MFANIKARQRHKRLNKNNIVVRDKSVNNEDILFLGERSGIWPILKSSIPNRKAIAYSFGLGNNISWELELINNFDVDVFAYDPTPSSVDWLKKQTLPNE